MPFKTILNEDILKLVCDYAGINPRFTYYKQMKKSITGYRDLKLVYSCSKCNKNIRNLDTAIYGFMLDNYKYYNVDMTDYYLSDGISSYYHAKYRSVRLYRSDKEIDRNEKLREKLDSLNGELDETRPFHYILKMRNIWYDGKILGKLIIKTIHNIENIYDRFNRERRRLERLGLNVEVDMIKKENYVKTIKNSLLENNKIDLGYYCSNCSRSVSFRSFLKY